MQPLKGKNALITGGSRGIGAASAFHLATAGANIAITYSSSSDDALKVVRQLEDLGVKAKAYHADAAHKESLHKSMADIISDFGDVHILVNNAGTFVGGTIGEIDEPEYQRVMAINVDSILLLSQAVLPTMKDRGWGRLINLGSLAANTGGITAGTAYTTSKAAVEGLTRSIAREFAPYGITANVVAPAYVMSPMVSQQLSDDERSTVLGRIPVGRFCDPEEVAHAVAFLVDKRAGFITGEVISVTGGLALG